MGWMHDFSATSTPPRHPQHSREASHDSGKSSNTGGSPSNSPNRYQARYDVGLSKVLDDRVNYLMDARAALVGTAEAPRQATPRNASGLETAGIDFMGWKGLDDLGFTPPRDEKHNVGGTTPESKTPFRTPQSIATTVYYTPLSTWDDESDASPGGDYEIVNMGSGKDWLNGSLQDCELGVHLTGSSKQCRKQYLSMDVEYLSVERCSDLLSETDALMAKVEESLKMVSQ